MRNVIHFDGATRHAKRDVLTPVTWSVVITTKDRFRYLRRAIDSALAQTVACEVIVVDDASTDETPTIAHLYPSLKYIRNIESVGHSAAANLGIRAARGSWIKPLDDDDYLNPFCLEAMSDALDEAPPGRHPVLISSAALNVDAQGKQVGRVPPAFPVTHPFTLDSAMLRKLMMLDQAPVGAPVQVAHSREAALQCGGWNEKNKLLFGDDTEFWIRLAHQGGCIFLPQRLGCRTLWENNHSAKVPVLTRYQALMTLKRCLGEVPDFVAASLALRLALTAIREKDMVAAWRLLRTYLIHPGAVLQLTRWHRFSDARQVIASF